MAKTESTAVNELIALQKTATPLKPDPSEDLMFRAPTRKEKVSAARMTPTIPPMSGAEMPSLPRTRAPQGTQRGVPIVDAARAPAKPAVRMSTAARPVTIPTINQWTAPEGSDVDLDMHDDAPIASKPTRPSLPAPQRPSQPPPMPRTSTAMRAEGSAALPRTNGPTLPGGPSLPRLPAVMHTAAPVAAPSPFAPPSPFAATAAMPSMQQPVVTPSMVHGYPSAAPYLAHASPDMTSNQPWFEQAEAPVDEIEVDFGTDRVRAKSTDWKTLLPKLIAPTLGLVILGMFVGGFLAFNGQGGKKVEASKPSVVAVGDTKAAGELPVAPKAEPAANAEPAAKSDEPTKDEPKPDEPAAKADEPKAAKLDEPKAAKLDEKDEPKPAAKIDAPKSAAKPDEPKAITPPNIAPHSASAPARAIVAPVTGRPTFVDVRIDSTPSGATVTLIDRGKKMFLGTTPISTALDPSRQYDLELTYKDRPAHVEHLDPTTTKRLAVVIGRTAKKDVKAEAAKKPEPAKPELAKKEPAAKPELAKKEPAAKPEAAKADTAVAKKEPAAKPEPAEVAKKEPAAKPEVAKKEPAAKPEVAKKEPAAKPEVAKKEPAAKPEVAKKEPVAKVGEAPKKPAVGDAPAKVVDPFDAPAKPEPPKAEPKPETQPTGEGLLMISSKPPCEIYIDGVATGLSTPQRAMKLPAGKHKVTLVNAAEKIKKTVSVTISSEQPTKVIENFMK